MKWETHRRIARDISIELGLNSEEASILREASILPDKWRDYPHHTGTSDRIVNYIVEARRNYLQGDTKKAVHQLGIALHYIADAYTLPSNDPKHDEFERILSMLRIEKPRETLPVLDKPKTLKVATSHTTYLYPQKALNEAFKACLWVSKSVLSSPIPPLKYLMLFIYSHRNIVRNKAKLKLYGLLSIFIPFLLIFAKVNFLFMLLFMLLFSAINLIGVYPVLRSVNIFNAISISERAKTLFIIHVIFMIPAALLGRIDFVLVFLSLICIHAIGHVFTVNLVHEDVRKNIDWYDWIAALKKHYK